jgi:hypothetical protein
MMQSNYKIFLIFLFSIPLVSFAQEGVLIEGKVIDKNSYEPLPFASIRFFDAQQKMISGTTTIILPICWTKSNSCKVYLLIHFSWRPGSQGFLWEVGQLTFVFCCFLGCSKIPFFWLLPGGLLDLLVVVFNIPFDNLPEVITVLPWVQIEVTKLARLSEPFNIYIVQSPSLSVH